MELLNACLVPLAARWDGDYEKDKHGYKIVKLHDMLGSPWVGDHTVDVPVQWSSFWQEVEKQKVCMTPLAKEERRRLVEVALASVRIPSADGRRWLFDADVAPVHHIVMLASPLNTETVEGDTNCAPAEDESRMVE